MSSCDGSVGVYVEEYSMLDGDDGDDDVNGDDGAEEYVAFERDEGADEYASADSSIDADEVSDADGDACGAGDVGDGGAEVDTWCIADGDFGGGDAISAVPG